MPTETVYGLAGSAADAGAVAAIFAAKGRPHFNPLIAHVANLEAAESIAVFSDTARRLAQAFWPGPLTLVLAALPRSVVCDLARAGLETVAVRVPNHPVALALAKAFGGPMVAPSANRSGRPSPTSLAHALDETGDKVARALDGGPCRIGLESTVVSLLDKPRLLRPGAVTRQEIEALIGPLAEAEVDAKRSPGRMARHYAPKAPVRLAVDAPKPGEAYLAFGAYPPDRGSGISAPPATWPKRPPICSAFCEPPISPILPPSLWHRFRITVLGKRLTTGCGDLRAMSDEGLALNSAHDCPRLYPPLIASERCPR